MVILGGTAAVLAYRAVSATADIDTFNALTADLERAADLARTETGSTSPSGCLRSPRFGEVKRLDVERRISPGA